MSKIDDEIAFVRSNIIKCRNLKSAIGRLSGKLSNIKSDLGSAGNKLSAGGFIVDGSGIDVCSMQSGGLAGYGSSKIQPLIDGLNSYSGCIGIEIINLNKCLNVLLYEKSKSITRTTVSDDTNRSTSTQKARRMIE